VIPGSRKEGESVDAWVARVHRLGWVPANGGTEQPIMFGNKRLLYCVDIRTGKHAYINLDTDMEDER
jgi:hypothetical protein